MLSVVRKSQFKRDFKKLRSSNRDIDFLKTAILRLAEGEELPESFRDHALIGKTFCNARSRSRSLNRSGLLWARVKAFCC